jgi:hypothetical protein
MKHTRLIFAAVFIIAGLSSCSSAHKDLRAPCPDFGRYCAQTPINSTNDPSVNL